MNPRPHAPKARALPSCATLRQERLCPFFLVRLSQARVVLYRSARGLSTGFLHFFARFSHFFRQAFKSFAISALFVHFAYPYFLLFASYCFPFARFLPNSSPFPRFLCNLSSVLFPLNLHKARHFCPCKQFYAVPCSQKGIRKFLCIFLCYHVK